MRRVTLNISVIGTGYLGATHAACMAELGFDVIGVDVDPEKIESLSRGELPFHEPGLPELIRKHVDSGRLRFTTDMSEVGAWGDVHFIAVGTPQVKGGTGADLTYVDAATTSLVRSITKSGALIVGKSTVPVGTAARLYDLVQEQKNPGVELSLAWNPEFLREGFAVEDTLRPDRLVVGTRTEADEAKLREVYAEALGRDTPWVSTDFETAELVKVAANAFLATKISFINAFAEVTETVGGDITTLADAIGFDDRIGRKFLNAGVGFGGGCLPKDIRALQTRVAELGLDHSMKFLDEIDQINLRRRKKAVARAFELLDQDVVGKKIAVLGITFKPLSDDVRDAPGLDVAARLFNAGADVHVYDPEGNKNAAKRYPRLGYVDSLTEAVKDAELVVLTTEWNEFKALTPADLQDLVAAKRFVDARNVLPAAQWEAAGWTFAQLGRKFNG
ncbi:UDP-glucose/GDP-mannose dehydrogenase family protein [Nesterenkonia massiliensis]|uniref:UDP-glucose 6-dehydrogenase n=1 Tax=Nesterenkonia massiliensis TaxID=1232429 RepID=A0ABT2HRP7_9MICC|nr:UDP-glucose/GDP-mannose dehydrogenase family protein [Nesterenkonia massiliensis]MCT1607373.1 UDP-glucose/GDP-mannose dehydrogenase family protein [Nesterenkonia massiliensis]